MYDFKVQDIRNRIYEDSLKRKYTALAIWFYLVFMLGASITALLLIGGGN